MTDVTYYADFRGCEAEFAISESEFLNWCSVRGWSPKKIAGAILHTSFLPLNVVVCKNFLHNKKEAIA